MMKDRIKKMKNSKKGFTMMELIIVVAIIAILLALLAPNLTKFLGTSKDTAREANAKTAYTNASALLAEMATKDEPLKGGVLTITNGVIAKGTTGISDENVKSFFNMKELEKATVTITVTDKYAVTEVEYKDSTGDATYPKKAKTTTTD